MWARENDCFHAAHGILRMISGKSGGLYVLVGAISAIYTWKAATSAALQPQNCYHCRVLEVSRAPPHPKQQIELHFDFDRYR